MDGHNRAAGIILAREQGFGFQAVDQVAEGVDFEAQVVVDFFTFAGQIEVGGDIFTAAAELGFASIYVSEESGGIGLGRLEAALIMEAMAYGCPSTSAFISIHNMASWMIDTFASAELKAKYLPSLITMERIASYCLTEPSSGSDAVASDVP